MYAGSTDGVYRISSLDAGSSFETERVVETEPVYRLYSVTTGALSGLLAAGESGLYHTVDGRNWTRLPVPKRQVYAVAISPSGERVYAGTRPSDLYVAECGESVPADEADWEPVAGFRALADREDWGIPRHDGLSQVRSLRIHPGAPNRLIAGVEVGGVHVSDDEGETWVARPIEGFDAPHTDDVHHLALGDSETIVASTGSGLYRSTDVGRTWRRLDTDHSQRYARESFVHDGDIYAGLAPSSASSWNEDDADHGLFAARDDEPLDRLSSPVPDEVVVGWESLDDDLLGATHRGTLLGRRDGDWTTIGRIPIPGADLVRYLPLTEREW
ncbi:WD40/YVTN/BNR-like repeat-containing protein [Halovivax cerinus]|uniref:WD40/YVTN/BNR-like repeat-containing protein n=1 Tax=Halovivax cerinus TaxID=1487865 RepID=A0ABD5NRH9_9EURY|nr:glycosyl hydrolase [Halovivax cerinus]